MKITKKQGLKLANKYKINLDVIDFEYWVYGLNVELEHGKFFGNITNITNDNLELTSRIAIAHLIENPMYYQYLKKMEDSAKKYWSKKQKPDIFIK